MRKFTCSREGALIFMYRAQPDMSGPKGPRMAWLGRRERALDYRLIIEFSQVEKFFILVHFFHFQL